MNDLTVNLVVLLLGTANLAFNLATSGLKHRLWWCHPRGLMALPLFLSTCGFSGYYLYYGTWPDLFGVHEEKLLAVVLLLALAGWAFTAGTFVTASRRTLAGAFPPLPLGPAVLPLLTRFVLAALLLVTGVAYYGLYDLGAARLLVMQYGADQWNTVDANPWLRASVLGTPLLCSLITLWGLRGRSLTGPLLLGVCAVSVLPNVVLGGRKDLIFIFIAFAFAASLKRGRNAFKPIAVDRVPGSGVTGG
ncbi:MAG: hypothetical protein P4L11_06135 [Geothrix sp.]|nr:hypothetical protein [Geothrix sp.]